MDAQNSWTYAEITEAAERVIQRQVAMKRDQAYASGVWMLWQAITVGSQVQGDSDRLEALIDATKNR
jgi:hypothetical protein